MKVNPHGHDERISRANIRLSSSRCEDVAMDPNTRDHLAWTAGSGNPMHEVRIIQRIYN